MLVIELSCLWGRNGEMVIKEMALIGHTFKSGCNHSTFIYMFKPPYPESELPKQVKITNNWVTNRMHNISWQDGTEEYSELSNILGFCLKHHDTSKIYTKGLEKSILLTQLLGKPVINLDDLACPKATRLRLPRMRWTGCAFSHSIVQCALYSCNQYVQWLRNSGRGCKNPHCMHL
jgi:hypothetical protein